MSPDLEGSGVLNRMRITDDLQRMQATGQIE
jgi:hypothetical protein